MFRPLFLSSLLVLIAIAGCFDDEAPAPTTGTSRSNDPGEGDYEVTIRNHTAEAFVGAPINVTWEVSAKLDSSNATNQSVLVRHTSIHWGNESVSNPARGPAPGGTIPTSPTSTLTTTPPTNSLVLLMTSHATTTTTTSTSTSTSTTGATGSATTGTSPTGGGSQSGPQDYANETDEQSGPPGTYNESFVVEGAGLVYLRAHAIIGNTTFWSDEVVVNVTANATFTGTQHMVEIGKTRAGPVSDYTPTTVNVKVGDRVVWKNIDALSLPHTATSQTGNPSFDTGQIAKNVISKPVYFNATGTWTYRCEVHPNTMTGASVVVT